MTAGSVLSNLILVGVLVAGVGVGTNMFWTCLRGTLPALASAILLVLVRATVYYVGSAEIFVELGITWLLMVVVVEEVAKFAGANAYTFNQFYSTGSDVSRSTIIRAAVAFGAGFAAIEHLLFVVQPFSLFMVRWIFATGIHMGTTLLYFSLSRPKLGHFRRTGVLMAGIAIHLAYNLTIMLAGHLTFS